MGKFDPNSERAIRGLKFQEDVMRDLEDEFLSARSTRGWLSIIDPHLSEVQLNVLEQTWGDIVVWITSNADPIFVECVSLGYENSRFPESKVKKFMGDNKFYAFGWEGGETKYIPSATWNAYARKLESFVRFGREFRKFSRGHITSVRKSYVGTEQFKTLLETTQ